MNDAEKCFLSYWLQELPTVDSHYCRNTPSYQNKKFLYPGTTIAQLQRDYTKAAEDNGTRALSIATFTEVFHEQSYSVFIPRKDRCDVCESFKHGNITQEVYDAHTALKNEARDEKSSDKESSSTKRSVWTMDLQAVLLCPNTKASSMYYKTKLQLHNFTLFDLRSKDGYCYIWNESEGDLSSEVFAYLQYQHFASIICNNPGLEEIVIWSDGCGYQNRNTNVANVYSALSQQYGITITQKFLVAGHTQMECDSMHSTIERKLVTDIFTERDYVILLQSARLRPSPYHVKQIKHSDFMKMHGSYFSSIRPGKKTGDPTVHDLRALMYKSNGEVQYKLSFSKETAWQNLPHRVQVLKEVKWLPMFDAALPIKARKYKDLQSMKHIIPAECHPFFDLLPYE